MAKKEMKSKETNMEWEAVSRTPFREHLNHF
jgi:hypothetical protein